MIKTILWDVDGTLLNFLASERYSLTKCLNNIGVNATDEMVSCYSAINDKCWKEFELGEIVKEDIFRKRFKKFFNEIKIECEDIEAFNKEYLKGLGEVYYYQDDSLSLCQKLKKNYKQYAVTNGDRNTQKSKMQLSGFDKLMDDMFISEAVGCPKPQKKFFDYCFEKIGDIKKDETIIVGDSLSSDMLGGNNAGILCCWYNPTHNEKPGDIRIDFEIDNLNKIWEVLKIR